jgi:hypothetical protein
VSIDNGPLAAIAPILIPLAILAIVAAVVGPLPKRHRAKKAAAPEFEEQSGRPVNFSHFRVCGALVSNAERRFLHALDSVVQGRYRIFCKVRVIDVIAPASGIDWKDQQSARGRVIQKHFDFVLCEPSDLRVVAAIELDDKSHARPDRVERDVFMVQLCNACGLPLIRFRAAEAYDLHAVHAQINAALAAPRATF